MHCLRVAKKQDINICICSSLGAQYVAKIHSDNWYSQWQTDSYTLHVVCSLYYLIINAGKPSRSLWYNYCQVSIVIFKSCMSKLSSWNWDLQKYTWLTDSVSMKQQEIWAKLTRRAKAYSIFSSVVIVSKVAYYLDSANRDHNTHRP